MGGRKRKAQQRNTQTFRSSVFADDRPEDVAAALQRGGKRKGIQPKVDTFEHLFGSSLSSQTPSVSTTRRIFQTEQQSRARRCSLRPSLFPMDLNRNSFNDDTTSVLHRPLELNRTFEKQRSSSNSCAKDCPASTTEFPPLERTIRATGGRPLADSYLVPMATETWEDVLPRDIFWLGNPPVDFSNSTDDAERIRVEEASYAASAQSPLDSGGGAIYWLGDPVVDAPQQRSDSLRPNQFDLRHNRAAAAACKIRQAPRNGILL